MAKIMIFKFIDVALKFNFSWQQKQTLRLYKDIKNFIIRENTSIGNVLYVGKYQIIHGGSFIVAKKNIQQG